MNVLGLFDGISCGQVALQRAGVKYEQYFASEIDKYAIQITQKNFPDTVQLGDITEVRTASLPKIDLIIGGSPCQGFSLAGKQLNFDDPRSRLFFEYVRLLQEVQPVYFLLENVRMNEWSRGIITDQLRVSPIEIDSALVSAQHRKRLYWTNIPGIIQPLDRQIHLRDILDDEEDEVFVTKSQTILATIYKENPKSMVKRNKKGLLVQPKSKSIRVGGRGLYDKHEWDSVDYKHLRKLSVTECERLQTLPDGYTEGVSKTQRYKMLGNAWTVDVIAHILSGIQQLP